MKNQRQTPALASPVSASVPLESSTRGNGSGQTWPVRSLDRSLLAAIQRRLGAEPVRIQLWDGSTTYTSRQQPSATLVIWNRPTLLRLLYNPDFWFGEAFTAGTIEIEGDLNSLLEAIYRTAGRPGRLRQWVDQLKALAPRGDALKASRHNIHHHYDIGNDFYRLWLDKDLVYTCAYFESPTMTLEQAQTAKLHHVCRKLRLQPGERVVEAGCGWGSLALHMARHYGVLVRAFNISHEQIRYARERAAAEGLAGRVEFIEDDCRNIRGTYDTFVSVGMLEHVGREHYGELGKMIDATLKRSGGRGLLHFIGRDYPRTLNAWIRKRIFPGGYAPTLAEVTSQVLQPWSFSVLDVENLRPHYAKTLRQWRARFEAAADEVASMFDEQFVRAWRLYLAGSEASFVTGWMQLFQVTFTRTGDNLIPWSRAGLYR